MRKFLPLLILFLLAFPAPYAPASIENPAQPVALLLVDGLTWEAVEGTPGLRRSFEDGAVANLSTAQGAAPEKARLAYALLGAGSRADTSLLPEDLPRDPAKVPEAFEGAISSVRPGSLGEALARGGVRVAAVGDRAFLAVMDEEGRVPETYAAAEPVAGLQAALSDGATLVAVEAGSPVEAGRVAAAARGAGALVAVASPNAPTGAPNLTPFALGGREGLLYSPSTRTEGLISGPDVAPTLLTALGVELPPEMSGRASTVVPGTITEAERLAERLGERLAFVAEERYAVWAVVGAVVAAGLLTGGFWRGRTGVSGVLLWVSALPAAALAVAAVPVANVPAVAALILALSAMLAALSRRLSTALTGAVAGVYLTTAALILADTSLGGALMNLSVLGYNPAHGTRFYGVGNEYAAFLAGSLTVGLGALACRRRLPVLTTLATLVLAVLVLGLPTMGADVGGSLALGFGLGATLGLIRGDLKLAVLWAAGGSALAAALFLLSGILFPGASHGSRAAGGETDLVELVFRKLLLNLDLLLNPAFLLIFAGTLIAIFLGWRRTRDTPLAAGLLGAVLTALATGALNDSGIVAAIYVLAYPAAAALMVLFAAEKPRNRVR